MILLFLLFQWGSSLDLVIHNISCVWTASSHVMSCTVNATNHLYVKSVMVMHEETIDIEPV